MIVSKISLKGQTTLPKQVRQALGVEAGDRVCYFVYDNEVRVKAMRQIGPLFGALKHEGPPLRLEDMERGIAEGACEGSAPVPADDLEAKALAAELVTAGVVTSVVHARSAAAVSSARPSPPRSSSKVAADGKPSEEKALPK